MGTLVALAAHDETHQGAAFGVWMFGFFHHPPWNDRDPSPTPCARRAALTRSSLESHDSVQKQYSAPLSVW